MYVLLTDISLGIQGHHCVTKRQREEREKILFTKNVTVIDIWLINYTTNIGRPLIELLEIV